MVVRYKNKDGTGGILVPPLTPEERRWVRHRSTVDHGGPYVRVGPRNVGPAATSRSIERSVAGLMATDRS